MKSLPNLIVQFCVHFCYRRILEAVKGEKEHKTVGEDQNYTFYIDSGSKATLLENTHF